MKRRRARSSRRIARARSAPAPLRRRHARRLRAARFGVGREPDPAGRYAAVDAARPADRRLAGPARPAALRDRRRRPARRRPRGACSSSPARSPLLALARPDRRRNTSSGPRRSRCCRRRERSAGSPRPRSGARSRTAGTMLGPALAAGALVLGGRRGCSAVNAAVFAGSAPLLTRVRLVSAPERDEPAEDSLVDSTREGLRFVAPRPRAARARRRHRRDRARRRR